VTIIRRPLCEVGNSTIIKINYTDINKERAASIYKLYYTILLKGKSFVSYNTRKINIA